MRLNNSQIVELTKSVNKALEKLYNDDRSLIEYLVSERAVVFRFGIYLNELLKETSFRQHNLDCEYNRNQRDIKRTENFPKGAIPDILLHRRHTNDENAMVIEFKGHWNRTRRQKDLQKVKDFVDQNGEFQYGIGILIELGPARPTITLVDEHSGG